MKDQSELSKREHLPNVLIIDDDKLFVGPMADNFLDQGLNVITASTTEDALRLLNSDKTFDAVFTDIMMPVNEGFEARFGSSNGGLLTGLRLAEHIRKMDPDLPIIAFTASISSEISRENSPFDHVISKATGMGDLSAWNNIHERFIARKLRRSKDWVRRSIEEKNLVLYEAKPDLLGMKHEDFLEQRQQIYVSINENLLKVLNGDMDRLSDLSPREFEEVCAVSLGRLGYVVTITAQGADNGIDLIATTNDSILKPVYLVQCKRNRIDRKVSVPILRDLRCVVDDYRANGGIVMTSSYFTSKAQEYAERDQYRMQLFDVLRLKSLIEEGQN